MVSKIKNRKIIYALIIVLLTFMLAIVAFFTYNNTPSPKNGYTKEQAESDRTKKTTLIESKDSNSNTSSPGNSKTKISLSSRQEGSNVILLTRLDGTGSGRCNLSVVNGTKSYSSNAEVIYQNEYSTCAGFTIPIESLGSGKWMVKLNLDSGGIINSQSLELEVK